MIGRYEQVEVSEVWSEQNRFDLHHVVEAAVFQKLFPEVYKQPEVLTWFKSAKADLGLIQAYDKKYNHETIAFCDAMTEKAPASVKRFYHYGMTSSDVLDTVFSIQMRESARVVETSAQDLLVALDDAVKSFGDRLIAGRSHGQWAEPMPISHRLKSHSAEIKRRWVDVRVAREALTGKVGGPIGTNIVVSREEEKQILESLELRQEEVCSQIVPRDRYTTLMLAIIGLATAYERLALNLRLASIEGIQESSEGFAKGQRGSSAMPHKKNPILLENISGMCRFIRSQAPMLFENSLLWFERDISHSSNERFVVPDMFHAVLHSGRRLARVVRGLDVREGFSPDDLMQKPKLFSALLLCEILSVADVPRTVVYPVLQRASMSAKNLDEMLSAVREAEELAACDLTALPTASALVQKMLDKLL